MHCILMFGPDWYARRCAEKGVEAIFSATPPLESVRALLVLASDEDPASVEDPWCFTLADVARAHFYATSTRNVFIDLPAEDDRAKEDGICGQLLKTMYGTLDAADRWSEHYASILVQHGFQRGQSSPCLFIHRDWNVRIVVHGDDFIILAKNEGRNKTLSLL